MTTARSVKEVRGWRSRKDERDPLNWNLLCKIIVVGLYPEKCEEE